MTELERIRHQIAELKTEREQLAKTSACRAELQARADKMITDLATTGRDRVLRGLQVLPMAPFVIPTRGASVDLGALFVALIGPDHVRACVKAALDELPAGIAEPDRLARLAKVDADLDQIERQEEVIICKLRDEGQQVYRRAEARPEIVLE